MEADVWVENIPYNETRAYVQRVHWHSLVFDWLEDRKPLDVSRWLVAIRPEAGGAGQTGANAP
jgi:soluble lytic murein transglycosylase